MSQNVYGFGWNDTQAICYNEMEEISVPTRIDELSDQGILDIKASFEISIFQLLDGTFLEYGRNREEPGLLEIPTKKKITSWCSGRMHSIFQDEDGKLFVTGRNANGQLGLGDQEKVEGVVELKYFQEQSIQIAYYGAHEKNSFFVTSKGKMYACGQSSLIKLLLQDTPAYLTTPTLLETDMDHFITRVWTGCEAKHGFYETQDQKLVVYGTNISGQLGINSTDQITSAKEITTFRNKGKIKQITLSLSCSTVLLENGSVYSSGSFTTNGQGKSINSTKFQRIDKLKGKSIIQIAGGAMFSLALDSTGALYGWGSIKWGRFIKNVGQDQQPEPIEIKINSLSKINPKLIHLHSSCWHSFIWSTPDLSLINDFQNLYQKKYSTDFAISNLKCHQLLIKIRTGLDPKKVKDIIETNSFPLDEINSFLNWVYTGAIPFKIEPLSQICSLLEIKDFTKKSLQKDIELLYSDKESMDFSIIVSDENDVEDESENKKNENENEQENENEKEIEKEKENEKENEKEKKNENEKDNENENEIEVEKEKKKKKKKGKEKEKEKEKEKGKGKRRFWKFGRKKKENKNKKLSGEIYVHKLILLARSGLFREMFLSIQDSSNQVKDYTGKSIEAIELLIQFLYTNQIDLSKLKKNKKLHLELENAQDYYQLSPNSLFGDYIKQINFN
ncbi:regulator of chromosome condensation [Anaeramoeba flamelloides]|uniref:Regulator of chromosome condensation n=1 Tax=Anaeramoeba flamelloides TaxID=1746091 RepID=A0AAV7Z7I1_9EUKA|nr:regulator of chromosome condensation [Anaeramoeba flamelloides]